MLERLDERADVVQDAFLAPLATNERSAFVRLLGKLG
jgi:hypothetical protein